MPWQDNTEAVETIKQQAAERAIDDPAKLDRAARIVRTALARKRLTLDDLVSSDDRRGAA